jgi:deazaflavin-dependent oxidoreductase (nitroreductase family)
MTRHDVAVTPPRPVLRFFWALHRALWQLSGHRLGTVPPAKGLGWLFLVSTGRKSGAQRRTGIYYLEDGDDLVVVASNAGEDIDPQWWRNLLVTPDATVEIGRRTIQVRARRATADEEARLWPPLIAANQDYATYRSRTKREIPIVILEPRT